VLWRSPNKPEVGYTIEVDDNGLNAIIGIRDEGRISHYMADKIEAESDHLIPTWMQNWWVPF
jgi:hypothetical protein